MNHGIHLPATPYSKIAGAYDIALGIPFLRHTRFAFERLVRCYGIRFRSAADLGCGTGLFACYLSRCRGVPVFAVDRSLEMLKVARRNCDDANVCFLQQDIRCLSLPCPVDLVTANFDTMNHIMSASDLKKAFDRIFANLNPGGHFIFDLLTDKQPQHTLMGLIVRLDAGPGRELMQHIRWSPRQKLLSIRAVLRSANLAPPKIEVHKERLYSPGEVCRWMQQAGFLIRGIHNAVTLQAATKCPSRVIIIAQKLSCQT
ncbi:MAG: methyltransferase domain-containing protein [Calditrichaceae bacterium]|nr:methyltransferase domain-containing protein [Calditrichia bacterium]NUQ40914.1 methyltransferase domain-containing protein [Calditrichaceae bacterium]